MSIAAIECNGTTIVEGDPATPIINRSADVARVLEACLSSRSRTALLYPANLPVNFFDLSSGIAGEVLQKFQSFGIRVAIVAPAGSVKLSTHFQKLQNQHLALFDTREAAIAWLS